MKEFTSSRVGEGDDEMAFEKQAIDKGWLKIWKKLRREVDGSKKKKSANN
jgi:hypothetical protein